MKKPDISTNSELQRISWACLQHFNEQPVPVEQRAICYKWVSRVYKARFGGTFSQQKLAVLARLGVLTKDDTSRRGSRRYYKLASPEALTELLARLSMN